LNAENEHDDDDKYKDKDNKEDEDEDYAGPGINFGDPIGLSLIFREN
jgi:hypothetical protein